MTARLLSSAALLCCLCAGAVQAQEAVAPSAERPVVITPVETPATAPLAAPPAAAAPALPRVPAQPMPESATASPAGNLVQTIIALLAVLGLLAGLAWFLKRYGPKTMGGSTNLRTVGALSLGGRERIIVVEVGDQWIVVGASPGRVNALATMPKQHIADSGALLQPNAPTAGSFSDWLKQTIDKRNAR
jgi:flagellar protein FliO/FliZ